MIALQYSQQSNTNLMTIREGNKGTNDTMDNSNSAQSILLAPSIHHPSLEIIKKLELQSGYSLGSFKSPSITRVSMFDSYSDGSSVKSIDYKMEFSMFIPWKLQTKKKIILLQIKTVKTVVATTELDLGDKITTDRDSDEEKRKLPNQKE